MNKLPVIAAVVNHNTAPTLTTLLPELTSAGYDDVIVLDDASTDGSREVAEEADVAFWSSDAARGPGATYNSLLDAVAHPALAHFIDARAHLVTPARDAADRIRGMTPSESFGYVGGLVLDETGVQHPWNYGPRQSLITAFGANLQYMTAGIARKNPNRGQQLRANLDGFLAPWPDTQHVPQHREVYWSMEQNMVIGTRLLEGIGGFDETLRYHGIQDLSIRMAQIGLKRYFNPNLIVSLGNQSREDLYKGFDMVRAEARIARKHGICSWLFGSGR